MISLDEAVQRIASGAGGHAREEAAEALLNAIRRDAARIVALPSARADIEQEAWIAIWRRVRSGRVPDDVAAYVYKTVLNRYRSTLRPSRPAAEATERIAGPERTAEELALDAEDEAARRDRGDRVWSILDRVAQHAVDRRAPAHRHHLEQAWREIKALFREEKSQMEVLDAEGELAGGDVEAAAARMHTRHRRARRELRAALDVLTRSGELVPEDGELASSALALLLRRVSARPSDERRGREDS